MNEPTAQQTIMGGQTVPVVFRDGKKQDVFVAQLRPSQIPEYLKAETESEIGPLMLVTGLKRAEIDELSLASMEALLEADVRQNFSYARRYEKRRAESTVRKFQTMRAMAPEELAPLMEKLEKRLSQSLASLPELQATAAGAPHAK